MTKSELLTEIGIALDNRNADFINLETNKERAEMVLNILLKTIQNVMEDGENIYMRGFGSFINKKRARKMGRNVKAKTSVVIEEHFIPAFKPAKVFMDKIKGSVMLKKVLENKEEITQEIENEDNQENNEQNEI